jgi:hypothetical protein
MLPNSPSINKDLKLWMCPQVDKNLKKFKHPMRLQIKIIKIHECMRQKKTLQDF